MQAAATGAITRAAGRSRFWLRTIDERRPRLTRCEADRIAGSQLRAFLNRFIVGLLRICSILASGKDTDELAKSMTLQTAVDASSVAAMCGIVLCAKARVEVSIYTDPIDQERRGSQHRHRCFVAISKRVTDVAMSVNLHQVCPRSTQYTAKALIIAVLEPPGNVRPEGSSTSSLPSRCPWHSRCRSKVAAVSSRRKETGCLCGSPMEFL